MELGGFLDRAAIVVELLLSFDCGGRGKHATAADARDVQAGVADEACGLGKTSLLDFMAPERDGVDAVAHASLHRLPHAPTFNGRLIEAEPLLICHVRS